MDHDNCPHTYMSEGGTCNMDKMDEPTSRDWEMAAKFLMYYMTMDIRGKMMNELPGVYNRIIGREVVKVTRTSDNTRIGTN